MSKYRPWITVTEGPSGDGSDSIVRDGETGQKIVVDNQADLVAEAIEDLRRDRG